MNGNAVVRLVGCRNLIRQSQSAYAFLPIGLLILFLFNQNIDVLNLNLFPFQ